MVETAELGYKEEEVAAAVVVEHMGWNKGMIHILFQRRDFAERRFGRGPTG